MPKSAKVHNLNLGTPNTSRCRKYKSVRGDRTAAKISKYFKPIQNADISIESPYKDLLTSADDIKPIEIEDECGDFKSPKPLCVAKVFEISKQTNPIKDKLQSNEACKTRKRYASKQGKKRLRENNIAKLFGKAKNDNSVNTEHLHMAIALSKSEVQNADNDDLRNNDLTLSEASQDKMTRFKAVLEQFGFNMQSKNGEHSNIVVQANKRKKSRFGYISSVLSIRTEAERLELIRNKIALILNSKQINTPRINTHYELYTNDLKKFQAESASIFHMNGTCLSNEEYFLASLNVPHSEYIPGCLLRSWKDILGRDKSPERPVDFFKTKECPVGSQNSIYTPGNNSNSTHPEINRTEEPYLSNRFEKRLEENSSTAVVNLIVSPKLEIQVNCAGLSPIKNTQSPIVFHESKTSNPKNLQMLSPDLFISEDEGPPHDIPLTTGITSLLKNGTPTDIKISQTENPKQLSTDADFINPLNETVGPSLADNESVINITMSQVDRLKCVNKDFEFMQLKRLKTLLEPSHLDNADNIKDNLFSLYDITDECHENERFDHCGGYEGKNQTAILNDDQGRIDLTSTVDSDCLIIEDQKEEAMSSKTNLQRFNSFNSTTSLISNSSRTSDLSIVISDEELNYSTFNSKSYRKHRSKTMSKNDSVESNLINLSTMLKELNSDPNDSPQFKETACTRTNRDETETFDSNALYHNETNISNNISTTLDDITAKYLKEYQETGQLKMVNNLVLISSSSEEDVIIEKSQSIHHFTSPKSNLTASLNSSPLLGELKDTEGTPTSIAKEKDFDLNKIGSTPLYGTPNNDNLIIKTHNITPYPNYLDMDTPKIAGELKKFGLKPLKRKRGVQLLQYLYETTHPEVPEVSAADCEEMVQSTLKKRMLSNAPENISSLDNVSTHNERVEIVGNIIGESESVDDIILERRKSLKFSTCPVPLNIAWHNLLAANSSIRESMLFYEPLEVENLYRMLKAQDLKYTVQDLVTFLDKKCITIRTKQNTGIRK